MTNVTEKDIEEIKRNYVEAVNEFDFRRVKKCVDVLNWKWVGSEGMKIPEIEDMYKLVDGLFYTIIDGLKSNADFPSRNISTGGFTVEIGDDNHAEINFIVEMSEWYSDWDVEEEDS